MSVKAAGGKQNQSAEQAERAALPTRDRILATAVAVFARQGYHGTSVDDIVREAGSSKGAFYFHFSNKEALFLAIVEQFASDLILAIYEAVEAAKTGSERVRSAVAAGVKAFANRPALAKIFLIEAVGLNPSFETKRREIYGAFAKLIGEYLEAAVEEGDLPPQDTELAAYAWLGTISEGIVFAIDQGRDLQGAEFIDGLSRLVLRAVGYTAS